MLGRHFSPQFIIWKQKSLFKMQFSEWVRSSGIPAILVTSFHAWKDCCSQPFQPDSYVGTEIAQHQVWRDLIRAGVAFSLSSFCFLLLCLSSFVLASLPPFSALLACHFYLFLFLFSEWLPSHSPMSICSASPGSLGSWNVSCHEWGCGWEGKAHNALNKGNTPATRPWRRSGAWR